LKHTFDRRVSSSLAEPDGDGIVKVTQQTDIKKGKQHEGLVAIITGLTAKIGETQ